MRLVVSLRDALLRGEGKTNHVAAAVNVVPGWFTQKKHGSRNSRGTCYDIWPASCRNPDVPQALPPCPHPDVPAMKARALLVRLWLPDAFRWLAEQDPDLVLEQECRIDNERAAYERKKKEGK